MAKVTYKSYNQNDNLLFPHCIGDFIPENDPVRVLDAIVEHLDNRLADVMDDIFTQVVQMLVDAKFVSLEVQYIDGTKIEANANKYTFVWKKATKTYPTVTVVMYK